jgi:hypothetical protein
MLTPSVTFNDDCRGLSPSKGEIWKKNSEILKKFPQVNWFQIKAGIRITPQEILAMSNLGGTPYR